MMIKLKPSVEILDEIPYILLIPSDHASCNKLWLHDLQVFLSEEHGINTIGIQSPFQFVAEEYDFIIGLKRNPSDHEFCALKILFKSFLDNDMDYKLDVLFELKNKYKMAMFDGKKHEYLSLPIFELKEHIRDMQEVKKEEFLPVLSPAYLLN